MSLGGELACVTSGSVVDDTSVRTGAGLLWGAVLTAGSDVATLILYDNTSKAGTILVNLSAIANTTASVTFTQPVRFSTGLEPALTGTASFGYAYYNAL